MGICALALCFLLGGGNTSGLTVARVARGDGTGPGAIRGGDQVMLCLPDLVSGPGDEGAGMCWAAELSRNAGPQVAASVACAQVGLELHLCWLMSAGAALPCQVLPCTPPQVVRGMPAGEGDNSILGGVKLTLPALLEFSVNSNDGSFIAFWLVGGFSCD